MATFRVVAGTHGRRVDGVMKIYRKNDLVDFPDGVNPGPKFEKVSVVGPGIVTRGKAEQVGSDPGQHTGGQPAGDDGSTAAERIQKLSVADVTDLLEKLDSAEAIDAVEAAELANPRYPNGRATVLRAIEARRVALQK